MLDVKLKLKSGHTSERSWMEPSPLRQIFWNMTYACNYRCDICFADAGHPSPEELSTEEAKDLVRRIHETDVRDIIISGGEPLMRRDMLEILSYMGQMGITARIASNGSLLTDEVLGRLRRETLTKSFQISLDTLDPDLYCKIHRVSPDTLNCVLNALKSIKEHGFHTTVSVRLTAETLPGIPQLLDRAYAEGWATVTVHIPVHTRRTEDALPQGADVLTMLVPVFNHFVALPERWLIETYIPWAQYHPVIKEQEKRIRAVHRGCRAGRDRLTINPTGWLSPCVCMDVPAAYVGNVRRHSLQDVFHNSPVCDMMRRPQEHGICTDCPKVEDCGGGCRAAALVLSGRLDGQDMSCPLWQRRQPRG